MQCRHCDVICECPLTCSSGLSWERFNLTARGSFLTIIFRFDFDFFGESSLIIFFGESSSRTTLVESRNLSDLLSSTMDDRLLSSTSLVLDRDASDLELSIDSLSRRRLSLGLESKFQTRGKCHTLNFASKLRKRQWISRWVTSVMICISGLHGFIRLSFRIEVDYIGLNYSRCSKTGLVQF